MIELFPGTHVSLFLLTSLLLIVPHRPTVRQGFALIRFVKKKISANL